MEQMDGFMDESKVVLRVVIDNMLYPVTIDVLKMVGGGGLGWDNGWMILLGWCVIYVGLLLVGWWVGGVAGMVAVGLLLG